MIPSKKVLALILVSITVITGAFIFAERKSEDVPVALYTADTGSTIVANTADSFKDSDGDGLKDWEETLWGTDPDVPDANKINKTSTTTSKKKEKLTSTDVFARSFFSEYMNLKEVGLSTDKSSQENLAKNILQNTNFVDEPANYLQKDIRISSTVTVYDYGNAVGSLFKNNLVTARNEMVIFKDALDTSDKNKLKELEPILAGYKTIRAGLIAMPVPTQSVTAHLNLLNALNRMIFIVELVSKAFSDPVLGVQGTAMYQETFTMLQQGFASVREMLSQNKVEYGYSEPGKFLQPE